MELLTCLVKADRALANIMINLGWTLVKRNTWTNKRLIGRYYLASHGGRIDFKVHGLTAQGLLLKNTNNDTI